MPGSPGTKKPWQEGNTMVFRIAGGLLAVGIFCVLFLGSQDEAFTPRRAITMGGIGVIFLVYAIMGPKRLQGLFTRVAGDGEDD
jgi:hypothetical protein